MNKLKEKLMRGMNAILLDCDKATLYATQQEMKQLGCIKKIQLKMHLAKCDLCRAFVKQTKIINDQVNTFRTVDNTNFKIHLTDLQKDRLQKAINIYISNQ